jgi:hypothetical protein
VLDAGFAAVVAEPMIWLLDVAVTVERKPDARTARVAVVELDADEAGEQPCVVDALVVVHAHREGHPPREAARGRTDANGLFGFATPSDISSDDLTLEIHADGFNSRHLTLAGRPLHLDLRAALYPRS